MTKRILIILAAAILASALMLFGANAVMQLLNGIFRQAQPEYDNTPVFFVDRINVMVPFHIENGRYFIDATIANKSIEALLDTGSSITMLKGNPKDFVTTGRTTVAGFNQNGPGKTYETVEARVCIATDCDTETVVIVPDLINPAVLRGGFLGRFKKATFDFKQKTLLLEATP